MRSTYIPEAALQLPKSMSPDAGVFDEPWVASSPVPATFEGRLLNPQINP
jgi:hypothetical protein